MIFVTAIHGDEPTPVFALAKNKIDQFVAHPRALSRQIRFIDSDLNASFKAGNNNFESKLARQILKKIPVRKISRKNKKGHFYAPFSNS